LQNATRSAAHPTQKYTVAPERVQANALHQMKLELRKETLQQEPYKTQLARCQIWDSNLKHHQEKKVS